MSSKFVLFTYIAASLILSAKADFRSDCLSFTPLDYVSDSTLNVLEYYPNGSNIAFPDNNVCSRPNQTIFANLCRIGLTINTSNQSSVKFEAWYPETWTGRFLATGNGGTDGCIKYEELAYGRRVHERFHLKGFTNAFKAKMVSPW